MFGFIQERAEAAEAGPRRGRSRSANLLEHLYFAHIACLYCCYSTMLTVSFALFSVLLLVPSTAAVCQLCFGEATSLGCKGAVDSCPWGVGIKENAALVATIVAGTTASTVFSIASLLPIRFRRLFPRNMTENVVPL